MCVGYIQLDTELSGDVNICSPTLGSERIIMFNRLPPGWTDSVPQTHSHTHRNGYKYRRNVEAQTKKITNTHISHTHTHSSHTTWLINSNLNGRGLTSYTHAFSWCLEKTLQHPQWARKTGRLQRDHECERKRCQRWCDWERLIVSEWHLGVVAQSSAGRLVTGRQMWL